MCTFVLRYLLLLQLLLLATTVPAQLPNESPYSLSLKREVAWSIAGAGGATAGYFLNHGSENVLLRSLDLPKVSAFDRYALRHYSEGAKTASDVVAYASLLLPVTLLADDRVADDAFTLAVIFGETMLINQGITDIVKGLTDRPRPYLYESGLQGDEIVTPYDRSSFPSNHTSTIAAASFLFGRVFADYHPDSKLKPYVWMATATLPAVGGFLRVRAGQHFPSDVVAGYALGAVIGYTIPALHRKAPADRKWTLLPVGNGIRFTYQVH
ncbi:MAG: phosphatase PAP2 family protein [Lewinella sp.]